MVRPKHRRHREGVIAALGAACVVTIMMLAPGSTARAEYGDVIMNQRCTAEEVAPVVFPHWFHRIRYRCAVCHEDLGFALKAGGTHITMRHIIDGRYCGACHDGDIAWASDRCDLCHSGIGGLATRTVKGTSGVEPADRNPPPTVDGIHDSKLWGTQLLQAPREAFAGLPPSNGGNYVNWTEALVRGRVVPRHNRRDRQGKPEVLHLDVVRKIGKVWGATPPAVFPHAAHSEWMGCVACHPALFSAQKGKNTMTMAELMAGKKCAVCHGSVAFPIGECRRCHYDPSSDVARASSLPESGPNPGGPGRRSAR